MHIFHLFFNISSEYKEDSKSFAILDYREQCKPGPSGLNNLRTEAALVSQAASTEERELSLLQLKPKSNDGLQINDTRVYNVLKNYTMG